MLSIRFDTIVYMLLAFFFYQIVFSILSDRHQIVFSIQGDKYGVFLIQGVNREYLVFRGGSRWGYIVMSLN